MANIAKNIGFFQVGDTFCIDLSGKYAIRNAGPDIATNVDMVIDLPAGIDMVTGQSTVERGEFDESTATWNIGSLLKGECVEGSFCFEVTDDCPHPYNILFAVISDECDCKLENNELIFSVDGVSCCDFDECIITPDFDCTMLDACGVESLGNVDITGILDGQVLVYDDDTGVFVPGSFEAFDCSDLDSCSISGLSDVDTTGVVINDILRWNGGTWVPGESIAFSCDDLNACSIADLSDVSATAPTDGQVLVYNTTSGEYEPGSIEGSVSEVDSQPNGTYIHNDGDGGLTTLGYTVQLSGNTLELRNNQNALAASVDLSSLGFIEMQPGFYDDEADALANGVQVGEYYRLSNTNSVGLPPGTVQYIID